MVELEDIGLEPKEPKVVGYCDFCHEPIYAGDFIYTDLDNTACHECKTDFIKNYRRIAE